MGVEPDLAGCGVGLADVTTTRLVRSMNARITAINALTALTPQCAKVPIHFDTDQEAIQRILDSLALPDIGTARVVRILDTLSLAHLEVSESLADEVRQHPNLTAMGEPRDLPFDVEGNLRPLTG